MSNGEVQTTLNVTLAAVVLAVTDSSLRVLTTQVELDGEAVPALPAGALDLMHDPTLELALREWVRRLTGLDLGYVEQLYTFGDAGRGVAPPEDRELAIAYLALVPEMSLAAHTNARWHDFYALLPWEDWREGRPDIVDLVGNDLRQWIERDPRNMAERRERVTVAFGLGDSPWNHERVLDRYELLWEAGLVAESAADLERLMAFDHRRMLATALERIRGKIRYRPVVFELLPPRFTLLTLQRVVETLAGVRLHKQNFRRLVERDGLVEPTGAFDRSAGGRPAELFSFRRAVLLERPAPGVGLPR